MIYGQTIEWTNFWGRIQSIGVSGYDSLEDAREVVLKMAKKDGWTSPKWWQWWRWQDTKIKE